MGTALTENAGRDRGVLSDKRPGSALGSEVLLERVVVVVVCRIGCPA